MNVVIIEDEAPAVRRLTKLLQELEDNIHVIAVLESVQQATKWFTENPSPDLIISDIQLSDNLSFEIFNSVPVQAPIIFTTAFDQYAIQAFEHLSIDYLLKPIRPENLQKALQKLKQFNVKGQPKIDTDTLLKMLGKASYRDRFLVYSGENLLSVKSSDIAYLYSEDGATFLCTMDKKRYLLNESLEKIEDDLDPKVFFRANRQFLLNIASVERTVPYFNQKLKVFLGSDPGTEVIISKLKATEFKNWLNS